MASLSEDLGADMLQAYSTASSGIQSSPLAVHRSSEASRWSDMSASTSSAPAWDARRN